MQVRFMAYYSNLWIDLVTINKASPLNEEALSDTVYLIRLNLF